MSAISNCEERPLPQNTYILCLPLGARDPMLAHTKALTRDCAAPASARKCAHQLSGYGFEGVGERDSVGRMCSNCYRQLRCAGLMNLSLVNTSTVSQPTIWYLRGLKEAKPSPLRFRLRCAFGLVGVGRNVGEHDDVVSSGTYGSTPTSMSSKWSTRPGMSLEPPTKRILVASRRRVSSDGTALMEQVTAS